MDGIGSIIAEDAGRMRWRTLPLRCFRARMNSFFWPSIISPVGIQRDFVSAVALLAPSLHSRHQMKFPLASTYSNFDLSMWILSKFLFQSSAPSLSSKNSSPVPFFQKAVGYFSYGKSFVYIWADLLYSWPTGLGWVNSQHHLRVESPCERCIRTKSRVSLAWLGSLGKAASLDKGHWRARVALLLSTVSTVTTSTLGPGRIQTWRRIGWQTYYLPKSQTLASCLSLIMQIPSQTSLGAN
jgi:hypothetical protein